MEDGNKENDPLCPSCGKVVLQATDGGWCPRCLLLAALSPVDDSEPEDVEFLSPNSLLRKRRLGKFEVIREIARGGMGAVFLAKQSHPGREVALKVISAGELATEEMVTRFRTEAQAAARLDHPNIVTVYEAGEADGWRYLSMRWIQGSTFADLIGRGLMEPLEAVRMLHPIVDAAHHAHQHGILHRDIKPTNILLDESGVPYLSDFGLAKIQEGQAAVTRSNAIMGTPAYMPPEQIEGRMSEITIASDIYGLGAVLYEAISGRPPFTGELSGDLLRKIGEETPPAPLRSRLKSRSNPSGRTLTSNRDLDVICLKCLEKRPSDRYPTALALAEDLQRWMDGRPIEARPGSKMEQGIKWARRRPAIAFLTALLLVAVLSIGVLSTMFVIRLNDALHEAKQNEDESNRRLISNHLNEASDLARSGEGLLSTIHLARALELEGKDSEDASNIRQRLDLTFQFSPKLLRLWDAGGDPKGLKFSADGQRLIAVMEDGSNRVWNLISGDLEIDPSGDSRIPIQSVVGPIGENLLELFDTSPHARIRRLTDGRITVLDGGGAMRVGAFDPEGKRVALGGGTVGLWEVESGEKIDFEIQAPDKCLWLGFHPSGENLLTAHPGAAGWYWNSRSGERLNESAFELEVGEATPVFSKKWDWLFCRMGSGVRMLSLPRGEILGQVTGTNRMFSFQLSPDEKKIAIAGYADQARVFHRWNFSSYKTPLVHESGANQAKYSPDGRWLATAGFDRQLRIHRSSDHQTVMPALRHNGLIEAVIFDPAGRFLATGGSDQVVRIWDLAPQGGQFLPGYRQSRISEFSPDSRYLVETHNEGDELKVWDVEARKENLPGIKVEEKLNHVTFDRSGRYLGGATYREAGYVWDFETRELLHEFRMEHGFVSLAFSPNSHFVVTSCGEGNAQIWNLSTGESVGAPMNHGAEIWFLFWSPDGKWIGTGGGGGASFWDAQTGERLGRINGEQGSWLSSLQFSEDSKKVLLSFANDDIKPSFAQVYELPSLESIGPRLWHGDGVQDSHFSPDGENVVTAGEDNTVKIWDYRRGVLSAPEIRQNGIAKSLDYSPNGKLIAAGSTGGQLLLIDPERGELAAPPLMLDGAIWPMKFSPDSRWLMTGQTSALPWVYGLHEKKLSKGDYGILAVLSNGLKLNESGGLDAVAASEQALQFAQLLGRNPDCFPWPESSRDWHEMSLTEAEVNQDWFAVSFHLERLLADDPGSLEMRERLEEARGKLD